MSYDTENTNICNVELPYSAKLFLQELQCMSIIPRLNVNSDEKNILDNLFEKEEEIYSDDNDDDDDDED